MATLEEVGWCFELSGMLRDDGLGLFDEEHGLQVRERGRRGCDY